MSSLFKDLSNGIRDGIAIVADKTEEYTKIGKLKIDMLSIKRNIEKLFSELGGRTYELMESDPKAKINTDEEVKRLVQELKELEAQLDAKKDQIKATKAEKERKAREQDKDIEDVDVVEEKEKEEEKKEE